MKTAGLLCCIFSFMPIFSGQLDVKSKNKLDIFIDKDAYTFASDKFKVKVPSYNVDKHMRELSDEKLLVLLTTGSHYLDIKQCSNDELVAHLQGRVEGGGILLGRIFYCVTKGVCYGAITAGVIGTIVRNRRTERDAAVAARASQALAENIPGIQPFIRVPVLSDFMPSSGDAYHVLDGAVGSIVSQAGVDTSGLAGVGAGAVSSYIANNPTADHLVQNGVWEFIATAPRLAASNRFMADSLPRAAQTAAHIAEPAAQTAANVAEVAATGAVSGGFRGLIRGSWAGITKRCGEIGAVVEVIALGAQALGEAIPGPI